MVLAFEPQQIGAHLRLVQLGRITLHVLGQLAQVAHILRLRRRGQTSQLEQLGKTRQGWIRFGGDATKVATLLGRCIFFHSTHTFAIESNFFTPNPSALRPASTSRTPAPRSVFVHPVGADNGHKCPFLTSNVRRR